MWANYAQTSGYDADGRMTWQDAVDWADGLSYAGHDDWRLPIVIDTGSPGCDFANGGTDCGYNVDTGTGELAYLFYDVLGNTGYYDTDGDVAGTPGYDGTCSTADPYCVQNTGPFTNLESYVYWSGTEYALYTDGAWFFGTLNGSQGDRNKYDAFYAWAVRSGDAAVPEPTTGLLFGLGLAGLGWTRRGRGRRR